MCLRGRGPVARLDRSEKARMIDTVIAEHLAKPVRGLRILDIGCGNGDIAMHFADENVVTGIDVRDQRRSVTAFEFRQVVDAHIPFDDSSFDLVISNHVIEHIPQQDIHLQEMRRVLEPGGCAYLATPNRSSPLMEGHIDNQKVLRWSEMDPLFRSAGFRPVEMSVEILVRPFHFHTEVRGARWLPRPLLRLLRPLFPSHIFILEPEAVPP